jgi:hypothetical protein
MLNNSNDLCVIKSPIQSSHFSFSRLEPTHAINCEPYLFFNYSAILSFKHSMYVMHKASGMSYGTYLIWCTTRKRLQFFFDNPTQVIYVSFTLLIIQYVHTMIVQSRQVSFVSVTQNEYNKKQSINLIKKFRQLFNSRSDSAS